jgi:hypothetical protein
MRPPDMIKSMESPRAPGAQSTASAGWDIGVAAFALACMTTGFWRLWPGALMLEDAPLGPLIFKAGLAALGFVGIATRWEDTIRALATNPTSLVLLLLACVSPFWAITPLDSMRNAIILLVVWGFGVALILRFKPQELAEICGFAGIFGLIAQFMAHKGIPSLQALDGDAAFAVMACAWAAWLVPARRLIWLAGLGVSCLVASIASDGSALGGLVGLLVGLGIAKASAVARRGGAVSIIVTAWVIVACIVGVTTFALFAAQSVTLHLLDFFFALGNQSLLGQGFGSGSQSIADALGGGLGIVGVCTMILVVFATLFQALLSKSGVKTGTISAAEAYTAAWFATLGAMCINPQQISVFGPLWILFAASSFGIALTSMAPRSARVPLMLRNSPVANSPQRLVGTPPKKGLASPPKAPASTGFGLRPKI